MISVIFEKFKKNKILSAVKSAHPYEEVAYQIYALENENQFVGLGRFGELENEMEEKDFLKFVKEKFNLEVIRHSEFLNKKIKK
jgi:putative NIF3 family GTP cyclohydrolase 1 type 2